MLTSTGYDKLLRAYREYDPTRRGILGWVIALVDLVPPYAASVGTWSHFDTFAATSLGTSLKPGGKPRALVHPEIKSKKPHS
eukprot:2730202-Rhodomonas_salina.1